MKILIADDVEPIATALSQFIELALAEFSATIANDLDSILDLIKHEPFGAMLIDVGLLLEYQRQNPGLEGTLLEEIRKEQPQVQIILMSGRSREEVSHKLPGSESLRFIQKPFRMQELKVVLRSLLRDTDT